MTNNPAVLYVLAGSTDLQAVVTVDDKVFLSPLSGPVHRWLVQSGNPEKHVVDSTTDFINCQSRGEIGLDGATFTWRDNKGASPPATGVIKLSAGKLVLVPAKLDSLLPKLKQQFKFAAVRVFYTNRDVDSAFGNSEPVAVGPILQAWLQAQLAPAHACCIALLQGKEEKDCPHGGLLNESIVRRLTDQFRNDAQTYSNHSAVVCNGGGFPNVKPIAVAAARLYFGTVDTPSKRQPAKRVHVRYERPNEHNYSDFDANVTPPDLELALRERCIALVCGGDFLAAMALTDSVQYRDAGCGTSNRVWILAVRAVGCWLVRQPFSNQPIAPGASDDAKLIAQTFQASAPVFLSAFKPFYANQNVSILNAVVLESALQRGHIVEALQTLYSLYTQIIYELVKEFVVLPGFPRRSGYTHPPVGRTTADEKGSRKS